MKAAVQQPIPDLSGGFVVTESEYLQIIYLTQRDIHRKFIRKRRIPVCRIRQKVEWMRVAYQPMLLVGQIGNHRVGWKQACRRGVRVCSVIRKQEMVRKIQESEMPPIAGMKFLPVEKQSLR